MNTYKNKAKINSDVALSNNNNDIQELEAQLKDLIIDQHWMEDWDSRYKGYSASKRAELDKIYADSEILKTKLHIRLTRKRIKVLKKLNYFLVK